MQQIEIGAFASFNIAIMVLAAGKLLDRRLRVLRSFNIPEPVASGLLVSLLVGGLHAVGGLELGFNLAVRDFLLLYFFAGIGLNADIRTLRAGGWPLLILLAAGLARWPWPKPAALGTLLIGSTTALALYGLLGVIRPAFAPPPPPTPAELTAMTRAAAPIVMGEITLLGWQLADAPTLYWHAPTAPTQDWRVTLRITAEDGSLVWEWRRSPGYGRFATDRWPAGTTVRDAYTVGWPEWAGPGRYRVEVAAAPFGGDFVLPTLPDAAPDHPYALVGWLTRPAP